MFQRVGSFKEDIQIEVHGTRATTKSRPSPLNHLQKPRNGLFNGDLGSWIPRFDMKIAKFEVFRD
jgi:hypothetical protein